MRFAQAAALAGTGLRSEGLRVDSQRRVEAEDDGGGGTPLPL